MRRVVVLPQPEGPSSVTNAPVGTTRSMLSTATMLWPKRLVTWLQFNGMHCDDGSR